MKIIASKDAEVDDGPPPFLRTWRRVYFVVLCYLVVLITALYLATLRFRF